MKLADLEANVEGEHVKHRHHRIRRAKQFLRPLPRKATLHRWPVLKWFAKTARKRPFLWSFRVREVSIALYAGFIIAFQPLVGLQFVLAIAAALILRANLPVIMGTQLVTNFATMLVIYPVLGVIGHFLIQLFGLELPVSDVGYKASSIILGGIVAALVVAFVLDMIYRFVIYKKAQRPISVKRILNKK